METFHNYRVLSVLLVTVLAIVSLVFVPTTSSPANDGLNRVSATSDKVAQNKGQSAQSQQNSSQAGDRYNYTAQEGDSYSVLARKAVQTYGILNNVKLSQAQIVAAETQLTIGAGSPELNLGEAVKLDETKVKAAVQFAQKLNNAEKAAWQTYVTGVDFDTRDNGQA